MYTSTINQISSTLLIPSQSVLNSKVLNENPTVEPVIESVKESVKDIAHKKWLFELGTAYYRSQKSVVDNVIGNNSSDYESNDTKLSNAYFTAIDLQLKKYALESIVPQSSDGISKVNNSQLGLSDNKLFSYQRVANPNIDNTFIYLTA